MSAAAPVFVLGSPRSGTTLLYHMLLSSGNFAVYRAETHVFNLIVPRFGDLSSAGNKRRLLDVWLPSYQFRASGLDARQFEVKIMNECRSGADFLRIMMAEIARKQGVPRWAECTPDHLLYLEQIKREFPDAKIIHMIRDGRDVALSYAQQHWIRPLPWDRRHELPISGLYWEWMVRRGREQGRRVTSGYMEVRFEDLVTEPRRVLPEISEFIQHTLDYDQIQKAGVGSVSRPNTSFEGEMGTDGFNPVGRWKEKLSPEELEMLEALIGECLTDFGYSRATVDNARGLEAARLRAFYLRYFDTKFWVKNHTPLRRLTSTKLLEQEP